MTSCETSCCFPAAAPDTSAEALAALALLTNHHHWVEDAIDALVNAELCQRRCRLPLTDRAIRLAGGVIAASRPLPLKEPLDALSELAA
jgi:hypothetical protein